MVKNIELSNQSNASGYSEFDLLLTCAHAPRVSYNQAFVLPQLAPDFSWNLFLLLCKNHALEAVAYWHLKGKLSGIVGAESVEGKLAEAAFAIVIDTQKIDLATVELCKLFDKHEIYAVFLKGSFLSEFLYGGSALRNSADIDVLIHSSNLTLTLSLLERAGWHPDESYISEVIGDLKFLQSKTATLLIDQFPFNEKSTHVRLDLHWRLEPLVLFERFEASRLKICKRRSYLDVDLPVLDNESLFAFLCLHGTKHYWERLSWLVDIAEWMRLYGESADWKKIEDLLSGNGRSLALLNRLMEKLLPYSSRPPLVSHVADPGLDKAAAIIIDQIRFAGQKRWIGVTRVWLSWQFEDTLIGRVRVFLSHMAPTVQNWLQMPLSPRFFWIYWVLNLLAFSFIRLPRLAFRLLTGALDSGLVMKDSGDSSK